MSFSCKHSALSALIFLLLSSIILSDLPAQSIGIIQSAEDGRSEVLSQPPTSKLLRSVILKAIGDGYIFASLDTLRIAGDTLFLNLNRGSNYEWDLESGEDPSELLKDLANEGYPFASLAFDTLQLNGDFIRAKPTLTKGPRIVFDTISLGGDAKISERYLHAALGFKPGDLYSERKFERISERLKFLDLVQLTQLPDVGFSNGKAIVYLNAGDRKRDSFEGILGLLPRAGGGSTLTGYINLDLNNLFRSGKSFYLNWNRFSESSQRLDLKYGHPFLLGSRVNLATDLSILRQDSVFTKRHFGLDVQVPMTSAWYVGLRLMSEASDIQAMTPSSENGLDYRLSEYRPVLGWGTLDQIVRFEKSFGFKLSLGFADKRIRRNAVFPEEVYDTIQFRTNNYRLDLAAQIQRKIRKRSAIFSRLELGVLEGDELVRNEFYRAGGLKSLRGFDENIFFVPRFAKVQSEYRLFFSDRSFLLVLFDMALLDRRNAGLDEMDFLQSYGGGLSLDTVNGNFNFIFAIGKDDETNFDVRNTKIHFGYTVSF